MEPEQEPDECVSWTFSPASFIRTSFSFPSHDQAVLLPVQVYVSAGQSYELETKLRRLEQSAKNRFGGTTDSELSELEDVVALTAARVQSAESEVSQTAPADVTSVQKLVSITHCVCLPSRCRTLRVRSQL